MSTEDTADVGVLFAAFQRAGALCCLGALVGGHVDMDNPTVKAWVKQTFGPLSPAAIETLAGLASYLEALLRDHYTLGAAVAFMLEIGMFEAFMDPQSAFLPPTSQGAH